MLFGGLAVLAQYLPARFGVPIGVAAVALALWKLGLDGLFSWQSWVIVALIGLVLYRSYRAVKSWHDIREVDIAPNATLVDLDQVYKTTHEIIERKDKLAEEASGCAWESYRPHFSALERYKKNIEVWGEKDAVIQELNLSLSNPLLDSRVKSDETLTALIRNNDEYVVKVGSRTLRDEVEKLFRLQDEGHRNWLHGVMLGTTNSVVNSQILRKRYAELVSARLSRVMGMVTGLQEAIAKRNKND